MSSTASIIATNSYMNIATVCPDGSPWNTPVFFAGDLKQGLIWWSSVNSQHTKNISIDDRVFVTIFDSKEEEGEGLGVYIKGKARQVTDQQLELALDIYNSKAKSFKLSKENSAGSAPTRLFMLKSEQVWINDASEKNGFYEDVRKEVL